MRNVITVLAVSLMTLTSCTKDEIRDVQECYEIVELQNVVLKVEGKEDQKFVAMRFSNGVSRMELQDKWFTLYNGYQLGDEFCDLASEWNKALNN